MIQQFLKETVVPDMDKVLASVLKETADETVFSPERSFRITEANSSLWKLSDEGCDALYDWPDIGWLYLSVYQPKRVVQLVGILDEICQQASGKNLKVWDFGCGTGAVLWALAYLQFPRQSGEKGRPASVEYHGIDASIVMLNAAEEAWTCWENTNREETISSPSIEVTWHLNTWEQHQFPEDDTEELSLISGSYLFDASDQDRRGALVKRFKEIVHTASPDWVCLTAPYQKRELIEGLDSIMQSYERQPTKEGKEFVGTQELEQTSQQKKQIIDKFGVGISKTTRVNDKESFWLQTRFYCKAKDVTHSRDPGRAWSPYHKCLSDPGIVEWTDEQRKARDGELPMVLLGAVGSGKSLLLIDRVVTVLVENEKKLLGFRDHGKILIVVQEKDGINRLCEWFDKLCRASGLKQILKRKKNKENFKRYEPGGPEKQYSVTFCNFDKLVRDTLKENGDPLPDRVMDWWDKKLWDDESWNAITGLQEYKDLPPRTQSRDFFLKEYRRVFHGLNANTLKEYEDVRRRGVEHSNLAKTHRGNMFACLRKMRELMRQWVYEDDSRKDSWTFRRCRVREKQVAQKYEFLFIDEGQDFNLAEYQWLYSHVEDASNSMVCTDTTQSIHTGSSAHVPREATMKRRNVVKVRRSIRMPYQIARFLEGLSQSVLKNQEEQGQDPEDGQVMLQASKESVPGIRPVVVHGSSREEAVSQVRDVIGTYRRGDQNREEVWCFDDNRKDKDLEFVKQLSDGVDDKREVKGRPLRLKKVFKAKGDECSCVVWLTDGEFYGVQSTEHDESAFVVMSRATFLLIIVITDDTTDENWRVLSRCNPQHAMFWTEGAKNEFTNKTAKNG